MWQTCPFILFFFFLKSYVGREREKTECRMSEGWSLQTDLLAVFVSACGAISQTARVCRSAAAVCQKWLETPAGHCGGYAAPARLTGGIITDTPAIFNGQLVRVCARGGVCMGDFTPPRPQTHTEIDRAKISLSFMLLLSSSLLFFSWNRLRLQGEG